MTTYNKYVTDEGKTEVLRLAFSDKGVPFSYFALGRETSDKVNGNEWHELENYTRAFCTVEEPDTNDGSKHIKISATFNESNLQYIGDETIKEIGLCSNEMKDTENDIFFAYCQVPAIPINSSSSFKYTMIISIE